MRSEDIVITVTYVIKIVVLSTAITLALRGRLSDFALRWMTAAAVCLLCLYFLILFGAMIPPDYHIFWRAGRDVWAGIDPYSPERFAMNPFLNPPTALPVFAIFAVLPFRASFVVWAVLNLLICLTLPLYSLRALAAQERLDAGMGREPSSPLRLAWRDLIGLTAAFAVSDAFVRGLYAGQLGLLTAFFLVAALDAQGRRRPVIAGICLALATIKVGTMLPFLLLFHRKADIPSWIALGAATLVLCLATSPPDALPGRIVDTARRIEVLSAPGKVNDYSFQGTQNESMLGFDHLLYRLGLRERRVIKVLQYLAIGALGLWTAYQVVLTRLPRDAACSLVALFSMLFLYHRDYDTLILAIPLVYCVSRARSEPGRPRQLFTGCAVAIYLILFVNLRILGFLTVGSQSWGIPGRLIQVTLLPYATWLILLVMFGIVTAESRAGDRKARLASA
jgi:hypothetical protein